MTLRLRLRQRRPQPELLDQDGLPFSEIEASLADIRWVNRRWGGIRAAERTVLAAILRDGGEASILDVGSGSGDVPAAIARRAARRGVAVSVVALDRQLAHLAVARRTCGLRRLATADARRLPLADGSVDWAFSALFFHHFSPEDNAAILREMARVARRGVVVVDLRRNGAARMIVAALGPLVFRSRLSVEDGRVSVEQAYTVSEAERIARDAGLRGVSVRKLAPFRLAISARAGLRRSATAQQPASDAAIIGAGPGGSLAALALRRLGRSVVVLERDRFPREKVCGEFLSPEALDDLDAWGFADALRIAGAERIDRGVFYFDGGRSVEFALPRPAAGISRYALDAILARAAADAGAVVRFGTAAADVDGDLDEGFSISVSGEDAIPARTVIAAWGRWTALDRAFGREFASRTRGRSFGWSRRWTGETAHLAGRVHLYFFRGGYCGLSRVEGGAVNFAGVVSETELRRRGAGWERFLADLVAGRRDLARDLAPLSAAGPVLSTGPVFFESHAPSFSGILAAGDAAGMRDPFTGDGQATAIRGGVLAANAADRFLSGAVGAAELEDLYRKAWKREFGARFAWDSLFRRALFFPPVRPLLLPIALPLIRAGIGRTRLVPLERSRSVAPSRAAE